LYLPKYILYLSRYTPELPKYEPCLGGYEQKLPDYAPPSGSFSPRVSEPEARLGRPARSALKNLENFYQRGLTSMMTLSIITT
jgi:hypothetical protein